MIPQCEILIGDVRAKLRELKKRGTKVKCIITSPPYWALRDYGTEPQIWGGKRKCTHEWGAELPGRKRDEQHVDQAVGARGGGLKASAANHGTASSGSFCIHCKAWLGQLGLEPTPELFVKHTVEVFTLAWDVLADDGTLWMNFGDSYSSGGRGSYDATTENKGQTSCKGVARPQSGLKPKDMVGMPWRVAFALQASGWYLRQEIIWHKPNPMPESVTDRCTKAHEHIFLLTKSERYYFNAEAIKEPVTGNSHPRGNGVNPKSTGVGWGYVDDDKPRTKRVSGWATEGSDHSALTHAKAEKDAGREEQELRDSTKFGRGAGWRNKQNESFSGAVKEVVENRNKRSVWSIPTEAYSAAHYATFPRALVRPCILAGTAPGDTVMDPFGGSGTVAAVAQEYGRNSILIDLDPKNEALMRDRLAPHNGQAVLTFASNETTKN